jgi:hypothetical protein
MPSSELAYKALHTALETRSKNLLAGRDVPHAHADVFVETGAAMTQHSLMLIVRSTMLYTGDGDTTAPHLRHGVFARIDKRCATAPKIEHVSTDDAAAFLDQLPAITLVAMPNERPATGGTVFEVRVRDPHVDVTLHFANPREPRGDLVALGNAIRMLCTRLTET